MNFRAASNCLRVTVTPSPLVKDDSVSEIWWKRMLRREYCELRARAMPKEPGAYQRLPATKFSVARRALVWISVFAVSGDMIEEGKIRQHPSEAGVLLTFSAALRVRRRKTSDATIRGRPARRLLWSRSQSRCWHESVFQSHSF